jgi:hypothetical protein
LGRIPSLQVCADSKRSCEEGLGLFPGSPTRRTDAASTISSRGGMKSAKSRLTDSADNRMDGDVLLHQTDLRRAGSPCPSGHPNLTINGFIRNHASASRFCIVIDGASDDDPAADFQPSEI